VKKLLLLLALFSVAGAGALRAQTVAGTVQLTFDLGLLTDAGGNALSDGSLIQIIASYDSTTLADPTSTDFLGGDSSGVILWQGGLDSATTGIAGTMSLQLSDLTIYANGTTGHYLTAGDSLFVRWYPALTDSATAPGVTSFGQYGYSSVSGATLDTSWVLPSASSAITFQLLTTDVGGSLATSLGRAVNTTSAVPEPAATAGLCALAALAAGAIVRRRSRPAA
jgi:hypothetical protein